MLNTEFATRAQIDRHCRQLGAAPRIAIEVNSIRAIVDIVRRGRIERCCPPRSRASKRGSSLSRSNLRCLSGPPCCCSTRGV